MADLDWIDTHAHLQDSDYDTDRDAVLARAEAAGVRRIILATASYANSLQALALARRFPGRLYCLAGCHPHEASGYDRQTREEWDQLIRSDRPWPIVALGEIGLDYHYDHSPRDVQRRVFRQQLELAGRHALPIVVHEREATADCIEILRQAQADGLLQPEPGVVHCFSGSVETGRVLRAMGFSLGFDGPITFRKAVKPPEVVRDTPSDRLLLETDSPYLTPAPHRGKRNEPGYLPLISAKVAELWACSDEEVARATTANAVRLFGLETEWFDELDEHGRTTGRVLRQNAQLAANRRCRAVHIYLRAGDGRFLMQRRSAQERIWPGRWDITTGRVQAGERSVDAARRELAEELGITLVDDTALTFVFSHHWEKMLFDVWVADVPDLDPDRLRLQEDEVKEVRLVEGTEMLHVLFHGEYQDTVYEEHLAAALKIRLLVSRELNEQSHDSTY